MRFHQNKGIKIFFIFFQIISVIGRKYYYFSFAMERFVGITEATADKELTPGTISISAKFLRKGYK